MDVLWYWSAHPGVLKEKCNKVVELLLEAKKEEGELYGLAKVLENL